jgi:hypothetical protein
VLYSNQEIHFNNLLRLDEGTHYEALLGDKLKASYFTLNKISIKPNDELLVTGPHYNFSDNSDPK